MRKILGASIGSCVHIAGLLNFLKLGEREGYKTIYLGGAVSIDKLIGAIIETDPDIVAISYRLDPKALKNLLDDLFEKVKRNKLDKKIYVFGGTVETGAVARKIPLFKKIFDGTQEIDEIVMWLRNENLRRENENVPPQFLPDRIAYKKPYPLFRHHIGLATLEETEKHVKILAESGLLDIISLAPDQNCQQYFFEPEKMDEKQDGAGGVPIRSIGDFKRLYNATRRGNYPLVRSYSGTRELVAFSKILKETINNAWAAIPLTWYSELDRRSDRNLLEAIRENQEAIKWNAENNVPVEINEAHQWSLRYAHDAVEVATFYLAAYNAKKLGVKHYVAQYMLSTPPGLSPRYDLAKQLAKRRLIKELEDENFRAYTMIRTGLLSFPADEYSAMGQLVGTMFYGMYLEPDIVHVVSYSEAIRRATSKEIIESVKMVKKAVNTTLDGLPIISDEKRVEELIKEAMVIIEAIKELGKGYKDPLIEPEVIYNAVRLGILDAPGLKGMSVAKGRFETKVIDGACYAIDDNGKILPEEKRINLLRREEML
ncbi:methionine synthase [Thermosipho melanesiensis]|uniref:Cobalamin B12-binding domain protein n=2 Tax=Thermosipho melanesiensis TaxID=46541 RepID=A6LJ58_THEM4|nr:methionine synthase [Thermosipho melanesiensis]ABR29959.1 cobalamin B12-binding domain protein [Thermosipho melanesiensis BI429]APT73163.1 methionine synthase [Thermosipho melanesiensis]OOC38560.1 methionine synthase [Thermosipho melanesiensis]OOC40364.1 methionine synthase [Thermosipho melanesiensis]OOC40628.1 methionine synthase [Thermosipho melanesiensis]